MLRYGIPSYRFPREKLDQEINSILSLGITVHTEVDVGKDIQFEQLRGQYDSIYISIGAHTDKKTGIPGEESPGVVSAVEMLRAIGDNEMPDFTGKKIVVIGGGNVAMDVTRSAVRLGAEKVSCVYRRRQVDMTALPVEVEGAVAEGVELLTLMAPVRIEAGEDGRAAALWVQPQIPGQIRSGRPVPQNALQPEIRIPADIVVVAVGQGIETMAFEHAGIPIHRGTIEALSDSTLAKTDMDGVGRLRYRPRLRHQGHRRRQGGRRQYRRIPGLPPRDLRGRGHPRPGAPEQVPPRPGQHHGTGGRRAEERLSLH